MILQRILRGILKYNDARISRERSQIIAQRRNGGLAQIGQNADNQVSAVNFFDALHRLLRGGLRFQSSNLGHLTFA